MEGTLLGTGVEVGLGVVVGVGVDAGLLVGTTVVPLAAAWQPFELHTPQKPGISIWLQLEAVFDCPLAKLKEPILLPLAQP